MRLGRAFKLFLRSNTHLALLAVYLCLLIISLFLIKSAFLPIALSAGYLFTAVGIFFSKRGAREIVNEQEEDQERLASDKLSEAEKTRERISFLRIADPEVRKVIEYFLLISGRFLEACRKDNTYFPRGTYEIDKVSGICSAYLHGLDNTSCNKRYRPGVRQTARELTVETVELIRASTGRLSRVTELDLEQTGGADRLEIEKETDEI
jgi:cell division protein FtsL